VPLVGVIDHAALDVRVTAARGLGAFRNGRRIRLPDLPASRPPADVRLVEAITRAFPNHRIYRAAYAHTAVVTGAADAMVDMQNHLWDQAPSPVLVEEAGGRYAVVRDLQTPEDGRVLSAVFGQPAVVDALVALFQKGRRG
jgi:fructose-1,6-bisphosphatase/inositol monophosphatase family enzyme